MTVIRKKYLLISLSIHVLIFAALILGYEVLEPPPVIENTAKTDVISAVVLGDSPQSKILPETPIKHKEVVEKKPTPSPLPKPMANKLQSEELEQIKKDIIAIRELEKKHIEKEAALSKKQRELLSKDLFAKDLLADIKQQKDKQHKLRQKQLKSQFEKTLRETAELSLREQLLNEEVVLKGVKTRQAQGKINKYKALILQAISSHWIVPREADHSLSCELLIRLAPGGMVIDVAIIKSSGDAALDSSARAAVLKSSPLPVPNMADDFEPFRQFVLKVKPESILSDNNAIGSA